MTDASPSVGRAGERALIALALDALRAGAARVLLVEGEPGIGKSHLLAYVAGTARAAGATVLEARASAFEGDLPYALFADALDGHLAAAGPRRLGRLGLADPAALLGALPALAPLAAGPAPPDRHRTQRALRDLLERLAGPRPLVVCLDDVHWADPASARCASRCDLPIPGSPSSTSTRGAPARSAASASAITARSCARPTVTAPIVPCAG